MNNCCWPECDQEGTFSAPKNPRDLTQRQHFCAQHIKEFNKRWNGLEGFTEGEIYTLQEPTASWQRPVWGQTLQGQSGATAGPAAASRAGSKSEFFKSASDLHGFFNSRMARELNGEARVTRKKLPNDVLAACQIFSIEQPLPEQLLKPRYLSLAKKFHPDLNKSPDAPEQIKKINVAYRILCEYAERLGLGA